MTSLRSLRSRFTAVRPVTRSTRRLLGPALAVLGVILMAPVAVAATPQTPVAPQAEVGVAAATVAPGAYHTCALTSGGAKCWGRNTYGPLGDGTLTNRWIPVGVVGLTSGVAAVAQGQSHTCALTGTGGVQCWGGNDYGQLGDGTTADRLTPVDVVGLTSGVSAVAAGKWHTCALTAAGGLKCWGYNTDGELGDGTTIGRLTPVNVSGLTSGVAAVASEAHHTCALTTAGGLKCWGVNTYGQLGDGTTTNRLTPTNVAGLTSGAAAVAPGFYHTCALTTAGGVKCWGANSTGQLGDGTLVGHLTPADVTGLTSGVSEVVGGHRYACALTSQGGAKCWGHNQFGQIGDGSTTDRLTPVDVVGLMSGAAGLATGGYTTCTLTSAGGAKCWGSNSYGQVGDGTTTDRLLPVDVGGAASGLARIGAGASHSCAVTWVGGLTCWGLNDLGQLGDGTTANRLTPVWVTGFGATRVIGLSGTLAFGSVMVGTTATRTLTISNTGDGPLAVSGITYPVGFSGAWNGTIPAGGSQAVTVTFAPTAATTYGGTVTVNSDKTSGTNTIAVSGSGVVATRIVGLSGNLAFGDVVVGWTATRTLTISNTGNSTLTVSGISYPAGFSGAWSGTIPASGAASVTVWFVPTAVVPYGGTITVNADHTSGTNTIAASGVGIMPRGVVAVATGGQHTCALTAGGGVRCWGDNEHGQLGDGTTTDRVTPVEVVGLTGGVAAVAAGESHSCALTSAGGVRCWGMNDHGQLGDGTTTGRTTPVNVVGLTSGVAAVATGGFHTCARMTGGGLQCWGHNDYGQLGDGTTTGRTTPVNVVGLTSGVAAVATGQVHSCAVTSTGSLRCWGYNGFAQLGDGTMTSRSTPTDVSGLTTGAVMAEGGWAHTCAITSAGGVKCWGYNVPGQLGDGTTTTRLTPVDVAGLTSGAAAVEAGTYHTCARTSGGGAMCWGGNESGQLGDGTTTSRQTPVPVSGLTSSVAAVGAGTVHTCAVTSDGGVKCWGRNEHGQLGDGTTTDRLTPVWVMGLGATRVIGLSGDLAFGSVPVGTTTTRILTISNSGDGPLIVSGISYPAGFSGVWSGTIAAGGSQAVPVMFAPTAAASYGGPLVVAADHTSGTNTLMVSGTGVTVPTRVFGDFDGDGRADYGVFRPATGTWYVRNVGSWVFGAAGDIPVIGDYDGDGDTDAAMYRPSTQTWYLKDLALAAMATPEVCGSGFDPCDETRVAEGQVVFGAWGDIPVPADYDGDGAADLAVFRPATGTWYVRGGVTVAFGARGDVPVPADYDGDGAAELAVFRPATGVWHIWNLGSWTYGLGTDVPVPADYDGDGAAEVAVFRPSTGTWYVQGVGTWVYGGAGDVPLPLDIDGDGRAELVVFRPLTATWYSLHTGSGVSASVAYGTSGDIPVMRRPELRAKATGWDVDGDGQADPSVFRPSTTTWWLTQSGSGAVRGVTWGAAGDVRVSGDYDGDGRMDLAVWRPGSPATWYIGQSSTGYTTTRAVTWGSSAAGDVPVRGDFDGDGRADLGVWRAPTGAWYILQSSADYAATLPVVSWGSGAASDQPVPGDYDGDGTDDLAVWRPGTGTWYVRLSGGGSLQVAWGSGALGDQALPGDYDGDGKADLALWRPTNGQWYILRSSSGYTNYLGLQWGTAGDTMVPADYDGDGQLDVGIFRPSNGTWYVRTSSSNFVSVWQRLWGTVGDFAVTGR